MPDQRDEAGVERGAPPDRSATGDPEGAADTLVVAALYVFFIALLLLVGAMTLLPIVLR